MDPEGSKEKRELEEDSYKILSQFYKEKKDLLYHTADGVVACKRDFTQHNLHITTVVRRRCYSDPRSDGAPGDRCNREYFTSLIGHLRGMNAMPAGKRPKEDEVPTQVR